MTRAEWDDAWMRTFHGVRVTNPDWDLHRAGIEATGLTRLHYGPRPDAPIDPLPRPGVVGLAKLAWRIKGMSFKFSPLTISAAIAAGLSAFGAAYSAANLDNAITTGEWVSIAWAVVTAAVAVFFHDSKPSV